MIFSFKNEDTEDIFNGKNMNTKRKTCPESLRKTVVRQFDQLDSVMTLKGSRIPPGNRLEAHLAVIALDSTLSNSTIRNAHGLYDHSQGLSKQSLSITTEL